MHFDDLMALEPRAEDRFAARIPEDWLQGRTAFGGLLGGLAVRALRQRVEADRPLRTLDVAFVAPVPPGEIEVVPEVYRSGRYATQAGAEVRIGDEIAVRTHAVFGASRPGRIAHVPSCPAPAASFEDGPPLPFLEGLTPEFTRHFEYRLTEGDYPFTGSTRATMGGWVRHRTRATGVEAVVALLDAWPAPVLPLGDAPFFASTVRWSVHLAAPPPDGFDAPLWFKSETVVAQDGYATVSGTLCAAGRPVAWTEQLVAYFERAG